MAMAIDNGTNVSSEWSETAAVQLLQLKYQSPSSTECREASELLRVILQSTDNSSVSSSTSRRCHPASLPEDVDATSQSENSSPAPFKNTVCSNFDLPIPVAGSRDGQYLSPLQCYIRQHCAEFFAATKSNAATKGRQTPVAEGRVGVRCVFCKHLSRDQQASQASKLWYLC
mmetsp:Transcript_45334/g.95111  ORF Transcript_45334/g.95111 Transcript_45334/m.95111 type:complete len:172 (-) Transcript_45334:812-1327(-)